MKKVYSVYVRVTGRYSGHSGPLLGEATSAGQAETRAIKAKKKELGKEQRFCGFAADKVESIGKIGF